MQLQQWLIEKIEMREQLQHVIEQFLQHSVVYLASTPHIEHMALTTCKH